MIIKRTVNGREMEFELTPHEMSDAYYEQQHLFDIDDVVVFFDGCSDNDLMILYRMTRDETRKFYDEIALEMRRNINKYDMDFQYAREEAVQEILVNRRHDHE